MWRATFDGLCGVGIYVALSSRGSLDCGKRDFERHITNPPRPARGSRLLAAVTAVLFQIDFQGQVHIALGPLAFIAIVDLGLDVRCVLGDGPSQPVSSG